MEVGAEPARLAVEAVVLVADRDERVADALLDGVLEGLERLVDSRALVLGNVEFVVALRAGAGDALLDDQVLVVVGVRKSRRGRATCASVIGALSGAWSSKTWLRRSATRRRSSVGAPSPSEVMFSAASESPNSSAALLRSRFSVRASAASAVSAVSTLSPQPCRQKSTFRLYSAR